MTAARRRLGLLWLAAALAAGLLAGCARQSQDTVVTFWAMGREAEVVAELLPGFEREYPGIRVDVQQVPWSAAHEKLLTAYAADALPDLCQLGNTWVPEFAMLGALSPLQSRVDASPVIEPSDYFPGIWEMNRVDGELVGVPWYVDTRLLFYRKDILREAGVELPIRTWDEWRVAMQAVKQRVGPDRHAILVLLNEFETQLSLGLQGDDPLLRDGGRYGNFSAPGFRDALGLYSEMFERGWAPPLSETQVSNVWEEFFKGEFAMYVSGPWNIREFRKVAPPELADEWGTMPLPGPDGPGAGIAGGTSLVLFRGKRERDPARQEAAWQFIEYLSRPRVQQRFYALIGDLPPRRSAWADPLLADDPLAQAFGDQLERVEPTPKVLEWERIVQAMRVVTERVVRAGLPQDDAVRQLDAQVDDILAKRRWVLAREACGGGGSRECVSLRTGDGEKTSRLPPLPRNAAAP